MTKRERATYSSIIDPKTYIQLMTHQHLYIEEADRIIKEMVYDATARGNHEEVVVEFGCGPARLTQLIATIAGITLTAVDHDDEFLRYGAEMLGKDGLTASFSHGDVATYRHPKPVDVFYSQGLHHHIPKGKMTALYLKNVYDQLKPGGCYILSDEFLASYAPEKQKTYYEKIEMLFFPDRIVGAGVEFVDSKALTTAWVKKRRRLIMVMWYSHIIAAAIAGKYKQLAVEEAKTLLDDLAEASDHKWVKTPAQIKLVLRHVKNIDEAAMNGLVEKARLLASRFLGKLKKLRSTKPSGDARYDLSRGDYKISGAEFRREVARAGFVVETVQHLGPIDISGGFSIYLLRKPGGRH